MSNATEALIAADGSEPLHSPESQGMPSKAISDYIAECGRFFPGGPAGCMHGFVIRRHGKVVAEGTWSPFDTLRVPHALYSHSKAFTSTAIGLIVDEGLVGLDERVIDIFPESAPASPSENLRQMRVRDLLTMNVGAPRDHILANEVGSKGDWVRGFLAKEIANPPGTGFKYDSDATYVLAAIVERRSGRPMMELLRDRLFNRIVISNGTSDMSPDGIPCGGWGMRMTTREISRFGQLYLDKGLWNGERVLSREWTELATARHTWSGWAHVGPQSVGEGTDWEQGYGFQFWRCHNDSFRADGASGQYTIIIPDKDAVVSINASVRDMQKEIDLVWEILLPAMGDKPLPENPAALAALRDGCWRLAVEPLRGAGRKPLPFDGMLFQLKDNPRGVKSLRVFDAGTDGWTLEIDGQAGLQRIPVGDGGWAIGELTLNPPSLDFIPGYASRSPVAASGMTDDSGAFHLSCHLIRDVNRMDLDFARASDGSFAVSGGFWGMRGCALEGVV